MIRRVRMAYEYSSRRSKRAVVGGSAVGLNLIAALFFHHALAIEISPEVAAVLGGMLASALAWACSGGPYELVLDYHRFKRSLEDLRRGQ